MATGIIGDPIVESNLELRSTHYMGWDFRVGDNDIKLTALRWYNFREHPAARNIVLYDYPGGKIIVRQDVTANFKSWGREPITKDVILKANKVYRLLIKIPREQLYYFSDVSKINFDNNGIYFVTARETDDMISLYETTKLSDYPDIEYEIL